jgi:hypothetical protein
MSGTHLRPIREAYRHVLEGDLEAAHRRLDEVQPLTVYGLHWSQQEWRERPSSDRLLKFVNNARMDLEQFLEDEGTQEVCERGAQRNLLWAAREAGSWLGHLTTPIPVYRDLRDAGLTPSEVAAFWMMLDAEGPGLSVDEAADAVGERADAVRAAACRGRRNVRRVQAGTAGR